MKHVEAFQAVQNIFDNLNIENWNQFTESLEEIEEAERGEMLKNHDAYSFWDLYENENIVLCIDDNLNDCLEAYSAHSKDFNSLLEDDTGFYFDEDAGYYIIVKHK